MIKCAQYTQLCQSEWISFTVGTARGCSAAMCGYVCSQASQNTFKTVSYDPQKRFFVYNGKEWFVPIVVFNVNWSSLESVPQDL